MRKQQVCNNCIMDTSDSKIIFDNNGKCDHCNNYYNNILPEWNEGKGKETELYRVIDKIKNEGKDKKYDCIVGLSGGLDSSYLLHISVTKLGLRPLVFCVDTCWNTEIAIANNQALITKLGLDSINYRVDEEEMMDLQLAFFKSQVPYQDMPQDQAIFAALYDYSVKNGFKYVLTGANHSCECVREPNQWCHVNDITLLKDIHKKFGKKRLKHYPLCGMFKHRIFYRVFKGMRRVPILNYIEYIKSEAESELAELYGWKPYPYKHFESIFTRFYEGYWLIKKYGYDKRKAHFSSLILTNQMSREKALENIKLIEYYDNEYETDLEFISSKLGISKTEFLEIMGNQNKTYKDYRSSFPLYKMAINFAILLGIEKRNFR